MSDTQDKRAAALDFLRKGETGVLATSVSGQPRARTVYYSGSEDFSIHFLTYANTRKVADLGANPKAAFVVSDPNVPSTLQMEGTVTDETMSATLGSDMERLIDTLRARGDHFAPITKLDPAVIRYYKFTPTWIRWGDFTVGERTRDVQTELSTS